MNPDVQFSPEARRADLALRLAATAFDVTIEEMRADTRRGATVAFARQVAMYIAHVGFGLSLSKVAQAFRRDRTTVAHACHLVEDAREDPDFDEAIACIEAAARAVTGITALARS